MKEKVKMGIICGRYRTCAWNKCFRALKKREEAFSTYKQQDVEEIGYTTSNGCPGVNIEYAPEVIHFASGIVVVYQPCLYKPTLTDEETRLAYS